MATLKAYTLGINGMPGREVITALGLESWIRQVEITPIAENKKAAHALLETRRIFIPLGDSEFRVADDRYIDAMRAAGLLDQRAVYARPISGTSFAPAIPVVRILAGGDPEWAGILRRVAGSVVFSREQMPEVA